MPHTHRLPIGRTCLILAFLLLPSLPAAPASAAGPWYVATDGDDSSDCLSPSTPCQTINGAVSKASVDDIIYIALGTYIGGGTAVVTIGKAVTLSGGWDHGFTAQVGRSLVDGETRRRGINVATGGTTVIENMEIANGFSTDTGGGVFGSYNTVVIRRSSVHGSESWDGGGGVSTAFGRLTIESSSIYDNSTQMAGGGIYTFCSDLNIDNSTISGNQSDYYGGAIGHGCGDGSDLLINSSTIVGNESDADGGGVFSSSSQGSIQNSILYGNISTEGTNDCQGLLISGGYNILGDTSGCTFSAGTGDQIGVDPQLGHMLGDPPFLPLLLGSPAIDAGNPAGCPDHTGSTLEFDQRGAPRDTACDIGAYEYTPAGEPAEMLAVVGTPQRAVPSSTFPLPLSVEVRDGESTLVPGEIVTFTAPDQGASGIFQDSGTAVTTAVTGPDGVATSAAFVANDIVGAYSVEATVSAAVAPVEFQLTNVGWYVALDGDDANDCLTPSSTCASVFGVFAKTGFADGDTILVTAETYRRIGSGTVFPVLRRATVLGGWNRDFSEQIGRTTVDGEDTNRGISIGANDTVIERVNVVHGVASYGGGVDTGLHRLTLRDADIQYNTATTNGGGIRISEDFVCERCRIAMNSASGLGGGFYSYLNKVHLIDSVIEGNHALQDGGGFYSNYDDLSLERVSVDGNWADNGKGGGFFATGDTISISHSAITNNTSQVGGAGVYVVSSPLEINDSTFSGNSAGPTGLGGAIYFSSGGKLKLRSSTVVDNSASEGGGVYRANGTVDLQNTILSGNTGGMGSDCRGTISSTGHNLVGDLSDCEFTSGMGDLLGKDAELEPLTGSPGYRPLSGSSPAINAGDPAGCKDAQGNLLDDDQRGAPRLGSCDIGAYEAQAAKSVSAPLTQPGGTLHYQIQVRNWSENLESVAISDAVPAGLSYVTGSLSSTVGSAGFSAGIITWDHPLGAGEDVTLDFDASVGSVLGPVTNEAELSDSAGTRTCSATSVVAPRFCGVDKHPEGRLLSPSAPPAWDSLNVYDPSVLRNGDTYMMWYTGSDGSGSTAIGLATSPDGITWTKHPGNPVLTSSQTWDAARVANPDVIFDGATYHMWYTGVNASGISRIGHATSADGVAWTKDVDNPVLTVGAGGTWEGEDVNTPSVVRVGSAYHMWYTGYDGSYSRIGHALSSDGTVWTKDPTNPVIDVGKVGDWDWLNAYSPDVVVADGLFYLWYSGETLPEAWETGLAMSVDGEAWTRAERILPEGPTGTFDSDSADRPSVLLDDGTFRVWYTGVDDLGTFSIGLAEASSCSVSAYSLYLPLVLKDAGPGPTCLPDYVDHFGDPTSGWPIYEDSVQRLSYESGEYQLSAKVANSGVLVTPGAAAEDYAVEVRGRRLSGTDADYGLLFGIGSDWATFYEATISGDTYAIWRYNSGWTQLATSVSPDILTGTAWNTLKVVRDGDTISLTINGELQTTFSDSTLMGFRRVGLVGYSTPSGPADFRFDDFALYPVDCGSAAAAPSFRGLRWGEPEVFTGQIPPKPKSPK